MKIYLKNRIENDILNILQIENISGDIAISYSLEEWIYYIRQSERLNTFKSILENISFDNLYRMDNVFSNENLTISVKHTF